MTRIAITLLLTLTACGDNLGPEPVADAGPAPDACALPPEATDDRVCEILERQ